MTKSVVNLSLIGLLLGALAIPALANVGPMPFPTTHPPIAPANPNGGLQVVAR